MKSDTSRIFLDSGHQIYPKRKREPSEFGQREMDCLIISYETTEHRRVGTTQRPVVLIERGFNLYIPGKDKVVINTLNWQPEEYTLEFYIRLVNEIEKIIGKKGLIIILG